MTVELASGALATSRAVTVKEMSPNGQPTKQASGCASDRLLDRGFLLQRFQHQVADGVRGEPRIRAERRDPLRA
jgi:hypothetical protein